MAEVPSHVGSFIWLVATDEGTDGVIEAPDVFDMPVIKVFYDYVTNRLVILEDDDSRHGIPTIATGDTYPEQNAVVVIDVGGNLSTALNPSVLNPFIAANDTLATPIRWPQPTGSPPFRIGQVMMVESANTEAPPTGGTMDRAVLAWSAAPVRLASVASVDLNTTSKTDLYDPGSGTVVVDYVVIHTPSTSLTTAVFGFGSAASEDWQVDDLYSELTGSTKFTTVYPKPGAEVTTTTNKFGVKCSTTQGGAATATFEVFGHFIG